MSTSTLSTVDAFLAAVAEQMAERVGAELREQHSASRWLTVKEAGDYLRTTEDGVRGLVKRKKVPFHHAGGRLLFDRAELDSWIRSGVA